MSTPRPSIDIVEIRTLPNGNLKALVTVKAGCFKLHGWRVVQQPGQRAWVSVPQEQDREGRWHNRLEVTNPAVLEAIRGAVLQAWEAAR